MVFTGPGRGYADGMNSDTSQHVTQILSALNSGEQQGTDTLLRIVYNELRRLAAARLKQEASGQTLQPTALVHEAYLRLVKGGEQQSWDSRGHFFAAAAEAMRRILIENARRKAAVKHGGDLQRLQLDDADAVVLATDQKLLEVDEAITELEKVEPLKAKLVKLRYFAGLEESEAAAALGISRATASRWWTFSKAWLYAHMNDES
ncbi:sigma-70 family RNA polymerase sigma factor [Thalassoglobus sp.]|uniref:sigma-70 family RNA polymerase sigma factor n=1 Tax=Thalassoglobus sp. TaxID=2795869 RepID=UPI003AA8518A